ncbi:hypothetical protein PVK06_007079 [Gossypium arboreum]|uniref:DUF4283 domain-containing protein n=1 Tax=Gossypium arboreum TaxID=29729 RepID=A0ABR0QGD3_GOSAR|nr:hypothetical protein PVK06_007079 [Gossypium arboreum]
MALTVIVKVLGKKVGFNALLNKVWALWSLGNRFQLINLKNNFYLVRFQDKDDFEKVLMGGLWVIFGHYLMVRLWSSDFFIANNNLDKQVVWIRLFELSEGCYLEFLLRAIGQVISLMVKIDAHTNTTTRGRFVWMAMCVDLNKPLVSKEKRIMGSPLREPGIGVLNKEIALRQNGFTKKINHVMMELKKLAK